MTGLEASSTRSRKRRTKLRRDYRFDWYTLQKLGVIMKSGLFNTETQAIKTAIYLLAEKIEKGELTEEGSVEEIE